MKRAKEKGQVRSKQEEDEETVHLRRRSTQPLLSTSDTTNGPVRQSSRAKSIQSVREATQKLMHKSKTVVEKEKDVKGLNMKRAITVPQTAVKQYLIKKRSIIGNLRAASAHSSLRVTKQASKTLDKTKPATSKPSALHSKGKNSKTQSSSQGSSHRKAPTSKKTKWFEVGAFLAVRHDSDSDYYLCRVKNRHIFNTTKEAPIRWLQSVNDKEHFFINSYEDKINPASVLMEVQVEEVLSPKRGYKLQDATHQEILKLLKLCVAMEKGTLSKEALDDEDVVEVEQIEPPAKRPRLVKSVSQKLRDKAIKLAAKKAAREKKDAGQQEKRKRKTPKQKDGKSKAPKIDELQLHPRPDIKVLEKDPLFETREPMPYVSKVANSRLIFRAIYLKDYKMLKKLLKDSDRIYRLFRKSVDNPECAAVAAAKSGDKKIFKAIVSEHIAKANEDRKKNNALEKNMMHKLGTGSYNQRSLGISFIRKIQASRGNREGNNAFTAADIEDYVDVQGLISKHLDDEMCEILVSAQSKHNKRKMSWINSVSNNQFYKLLLAGNNKRAGEFVENKLKEGQPYFTNLFRDVLLFETEDLTKCSASALSFESRATGLLMPIHCACVNPNKKYLQQILSVSGSDINKCDSRGLRPIHYAAACSSPEPLQLLLEWGANPLDIDKKKRKPLDYALKANRIENVKLLLQQKVPAGLAQQIQEAPVNRPDHRSLTPLHRAVKYGYLEMAKMLIESGADVNRKLNVSKMQQTPLMLAAQRGDLKMAKLLVNSGAVVQQKDRLDRTAVIHAAKNGATNVLSYLLHLGADGERPDNSGNTPLHYAAAYGWLFTVRLLLEWGANPNVTNMWMTSPMLVAFMKGHSGIVRELLKNERTDINFTDDNGMSLVFHGCMSDLCQEDLYEQIKYLVEDMGALCTIKSHKGLTPLHAMILANSFSFGDETAVKQSIQIAKLLIDHGCDVNAVDEDGNTAAMLAVGMNTHEDLADMLIKAGSKIFTPSPGDPATSVLHNLAESLWKNCDVRNKTRERALYLLQLLMKRCPKETKMMKSYVDKNGYTPLLLAASRAKTSIRVSETNLPSSTEDEKAQKECQRKIWSDYLHFMKAMLADSNINAKVGKRFLSLDEMPDKDSLKWYRDHLEAEKTSAQLVLSGNDPQFDDNGDLVVDSDGQVIVYGGPVFELLLSKGADVNNKDLLGNTLLGTLLLRREGARPSLIKLLVNTAGCDVNGSIFVREYRYVIEYNPLIQACKSCDIPAVIALIECGGDMHATTPKEGMPCLQYLIANHYSKQKEILQVIKSLAERGYDFSAVDKQGKTALHHVISQNAGGMNDSCELEVHLIQLGVDLGKQDHKGRTALHYIFKQKSSGYRNRNRKSEDPAKLVKLIGQTMTKEQVNLKDYEGKTALHFAAYKGAIMCSMYLLMIGADMNVRDIDENTPLSLAVMQSNDGCATMLISNGADLQVSVTTVDKKLREERKKRAVKQAASNEDIVVDDDEDDDETAELNEITNKKPWFWEPVKDQYKIDSHTEKLPLYKASIKKNLNGVTMFITDADIKKSGLTPEECIKVAMETQQFNMVFHLVCTTINKKVLHHVYRKRRNLLHKLALSCEDANSQHEVLLKIADSLISSGVKADFCDVYGCTPIQYAFYNRQFYLAKRLADSCGGFDLNWTDGFGRSHIAAALWKAHSKAVNSNLWSQLSELFTSEGKQLDRQFDYPVKFETGLMPNVPDPNYFEGYPIKTTPLIIAIYYGRDFDTVKKLLKLGANPNQPDSEGNTPLMQAVILNDVDMVRLLLNFDYDGEHPEKFTGKYIEKQVEKPVKKQKYVGAFCIRENSLQDLPEGETGSENEEMSEEEQYGDNDSGTSSENERSDSGSRSIKRQAGKVEIYKTYLPIAKTSNMNLNAKNKKNETVANFVAKSVPEGTFDNDEIAFILSHAGAKVSQSHLKLAVEAGAEDVAAFWKTYHKLQDNGKKPVFEPDSPVKDDVPPLKENLPPFQREASKVLKKYDSSMEVEDVYVHQISEHCNVKDGELMKDANLGVYYDVLMTRVDVLKGIWGKYNFYEMQLICQASKSLYILFTRWGRIGDEGQFQHTPYKEKEKAVKEFEKIFRSKSGNKWADLKSYEQKTKKYRLVEDMARKAPPPQKDVDIVLESSCKSVLPAHLHSIIQTMMNPKKLQLSMDNTQGLNTESLPFGQLNKERLLEGQRILKDIEELVNENQNMGKSLKTRDLNPEAKSKLLENLDKIVKLTNDYYHVIPQKNYVCEKFNPLDKPNPVQAELNTINNLLDYEVACKMLLAAMAHRNDINPVDYVYRCLDCKMELMQEKDPMVQMILKYIYLSGVQSVKVHGIYRVERKGEDEKLQATRKGIRRLLWHGSNTCNLLSILSRGLVVAPPEAGFAGQRFGKGIYFADLFSKSNQYIQRGVQKFMLLCDVALGQSIWLKTFKDLNEFEEQKDTLHDTVVALGTNAAEDWLKLKTGASIPHSKGTTPRAVASHTEYIVRNPAQVCIKYLIQYTE